MQLGVQRAWKFKAQQQARKSREQQQKFKQDADEANAKLIAQAAANAQAKAAQQTQADLIQEHHGAQLTQMNKDAALQKQRLSLACEQLLGMANETEAAMGRAMQELDDERTKCEVLEQQVDAVTRKCSEKIDAVQDKVREQVEQKLAQIRVLRQQVKQKTDTPKATTSALVKLMLPNAKAASLHNEGFAFGTKKSGDGSDLSTAAMQTRHRRQLVRTASALLVELMAIVYKQDPEGALRATIDELAPAIFASNSTPTAAAGQMALDGLVKQYQLNYMQSNAEGTRLALSVLVQIKAGNQAGGVESKLLRQLLCKCELEQGDLVQIIRSKREGSKWGLGRVDSVSADASTADVHEIDATWLSDTFCVTHQIELHLTKYEASGKLELRDPLVRQRLTEAINADSGCLGTLISIDVSLLKFNRKNVRCTDSELDAARQHVLAFGRGGASEQRKVTLLRFNRERMPLFLEFMEDPRYAQVAVGSKKMSEQGVTVQLNQNKHRLLRAFNGFCEARKKKECQFAKKQWYEATEHCKEAKAGECECSHCLNEGEKNFENLMVLLDDMNTMHRRYASEDMPAYKSLRERAEQLKLYLSGDFLSELEADHADGMLCRRHALAAPLNPDFRCDCGHNDGAALRDKIERWGLGENGEPDDDRWNSDCSVCNMRGTECNGGLLCCTHCNVVTHRQCIDKGLSPELKEHLTPEMCAAESFEYTCRECRNANDSCNHHTKNNRANEILWLLHEKRTWTDGTGAPQIETCDIEVALEALEALVSSAVDTTGPGTDGEDPKKLLHNFHYRLRECAQKKHGFHTHLVQDRQQGQFRNDFLKDCLDCNCHTKGYFIADYKGKTEGKQAKTTCTDAFAAPSISCHISTAVGKIPPLEVQQLAGEGALQFDSAEGDADGDFFLLHVMVFSDDMKQDGFKTLTDIEATVQQLDTLLPWVTHLHGQSDNASNYHHEYLILALANIATRIKIAEWTFSVAGEWIQTPIREHSCVVPSHATHLTYVCCLIA
jgi:hypothetical protein